MGGAGRSVKASRVTGGGGGPCREDAVSSESGGGGNTRKEVNQPIQAGLPQNRTMDLCSEETGAPSLKSQISVALRFAR